MKTTKINTTIIAAAFSLFIISCQRDAHEEMAQPAGLEQTITDDGNNSQSSGDCNPNAYTITLESHAFNGTGWDWI